MGKKSSIDILYEMSLRRLNAQISRVDGADSKIGIIFGLTNGIAAAMVAFIAFALHPIPTLVLVLIIVSAGTYAATLVFLFLAYRASNWSFRPDMKTLREICTNYEYREHPDVVEEWIADECIRSVDWNEAPLAAKLRWAYRALGSVTAQGALLAVACGFFCRMSGVIC